MKLEHCIKDYLLEIQIRKYTWKTIKGYRNNLEYFCNYLEQNMKVVNVREVNTALVKSFIKYQVAKKCKETYINNCIKTFRSFFKYCLEEEYISINPMDKVSLLKEEKPIIKTFNDKEVKAMVEVYKGNDFLTVRNKAIIATLFDTGIRCYELCTLKNSNVDDIIITIKGKGKKERQVGKSPYLSKVLLKYERAKQYYFEYKKYDEEHYFLSRTGKILTNAAIERVVKQASVSVGVRKSVRSSPHTCRHFFAQSQLKNGIDVYSLSRLLGHENIKITQRYLDSMNDNDVVIKSISSSVLMNL